MMLLIMVKFLCRGLPLMLLINFWGKDTHIISYMQFPNWGFFINKPLCL